MVEFKLRESDGRLYLPRELRQAVVERGESRGIPNFAAVLIYKPNTSYRALIKSLEIIMADLRQRAEVSQE